MATQTPVNPALRNIAAKDLIGLREIGQLASWSVSSSKPGFGIDQLLDPNLDTLWQSEGPQPHVINIQFTKRMPIAQVSMFIDVTLDDSYTPSKISLRAGSYFADLVEVKLIEMDQPKGWQHFRLGLAADATEADEIDPLDPDALAVRAHLVQVAILSNHLNGKDTHVRHVRIYAPRERDNTILADEGDLLPFKTEKYLMHATIR